MRRSSIFVLLAGLVSLGANYPTYQGQLVEDFANIIPADAESRLEARLREYARATDIEIVVATVTDLGGDTAQTYTTELFNHWGVGNKKKDNGVLFLHAPSSRDLWITVGYGLEPDLPDSVAYDITGVGVNAFKAGDFGRGTEQIVEAIIGRLGQTPYEARVEERERAAAAAAARGAAVKRTLAGFAVVAIILLGFWFIARGIRQAIRERRRKTQLRAEIWAALPARETELETVAREARGAVGDALATLFRVARDQEWGATQQAAVETVAGQALRQYAEARSLLRKNPDGSARALRALADSVEHLQGIRADVDRRTAKIREATANAPRISDETVAALGEVRAVLDRLRGDGYRIDTNALIATALGTLTEADRCLVAAPGRPVDPVRALELFALARSQATEARGTTEAWVGRRRAVEQALEELPAAVDHLERETLVAARAALDELRRSHPERVRTEIERAVGRAVELIGVCREQLTSARVENGMERQQFNEAAKWIAAARANIAEIEHALTAPAMRLEEIAQAKRDVRRLQQDAETAQAKARGPIENSDAGQGARKTARDAQERFDGAIVAMGVTRLTDWLAIEAGFTAAIDGWNKARRAAQHDIEEAERRRREEERRRREEREAAERRRRAASYSSSSSRSSSSFRLGGGRSGGGGGGRRY